MALAIGAGPLLESHTQPPHPTPTAGSPNHAPDPAPDRPRPDHDSAQALPPPSPMSFLSYLPLRRSLSARASFTSQLAASLSAGHASTGAPPPTLSRQGSGSHSRAASPSGARGQHGGSYTHDDQHQPGPQRDGGGRGGGAGAGAGASGAAGPEPEPAGQGQGQPWHRRTSDPTGSTLGPVALAQQQQQQLGNYQNHPSQPRSASASGQPLPSPGAAAGQVQGEGGASQQWGSGSSDAGGSSVGMMEEVLHVLDALDDSELRRSRGLAGLRSLASEGKGGPLRPTSAGSSHASSSGVGGPGGSRSGQYPLYAAPYPYSQAGGSSRAYANPHLPAGATPPRPVKAWSAGKGPHGARSPSPGPKASPYAQLQPPSQGRARGS